MDDMTLTDTLLNMIAHQPAALVVPKVCPADPKMFDTELQLISVLAHMNTTCTYENSTTLTNISAAP
jgi:hypothetical protein